MEGDVFQELLASIGKHASMSCQRDGGPLANTGKRLRKNIPLHPPSSALQLQSGQKLRSRRDLSHVEPKISQRVDNRRRGSIHRQLAESFCAERPARIRIL